MNYDSLKFYREWISGEDALSDAGAAPRVWPHEPSPEAFMRLTRHSENRIVRRLHTPLLAASMCALVAVVGCADTPSGAVPVVQPPNNGIVAGTLEARTERQTITLRNTTEFVVGYMVIDSEMATIALFPPCGDGCAKLLQGESITLPKSAIGGYNERSTKANVLWFKYQRNANGTYTPIEGVNVTQVAL